MVKAVALGHLVSYSAINILGSHLNPLSVPSSQLRFGSVVSLQNASQKLLLAFLQPKYHLTRLSWSLIVKFVSFHCQTEWFPRQMTWLDHFKNAYWTIYVRLVRIFFLSFQINQVHDVCIVLMYIHRSFFAQAIIEHPVNPLKSTYAPSFLAAYRASSTILKSIREQFNMWPNSCSRFWTMWTSAFSAAVCIFRYFDEMKGAYH